jgi:hypothetical protein
MTRIGERLTAMAEKKTKRKPGPPARYGYRPTLTIRLTEPVYEAIKAAAATHGKSLSEEIEDRLQTISDLEAAQRQLEWTCQEAGEIRRAAIEMQDVARSLIREANAARTAARVQAYRDAGFRILREIEGEPMRVIISTETLDAEAGVTQGFISDEAAERPTGEVKKQSDDEAA